MMRLLGAVGLLLFSGTALAEVKSSGPTSFEIENKRIVAAAPAEVYFALGRIARWWSKDHTYSGNAANLSLGLKAGDCFCERLDDGGTVEHLHVVQARPGQLLRFQGGLGPLQGEAVSGTLTFTLKRVPRGTEITQSYLVGGFIRMGADKLAGPVDKVLAQQLDGLVRHLGDKGAKSSD